MGHVAEGAELLLEPDQCRGIDAAHRLEGDQLASLLVVGLEDHPHSARPEPSQGG